MPPRPLRLAGRGERSHEAFDVALSHPVDHELAEAGQQVSAKDRPVVVEGRRLAPERFEFTEHQFRRARERHARASFGRALTNHQPPKLGLGLGTVQSLPCAAAQLGA